MENSEKIVDFVYERHYLRIESSLCGQNISCGGRPVDHKLDEDRKLVKAERSMEEDSDYKITDTLRQPISSDNKRVNLKMTIKKRVRSLIWEDIRIHGWGQKTVDGTLHYFVNMTRLSSLKKVSRHLDERLDGNPSLSLSIHDPSGICFDPELLGSVQNPLWNQGTENLTKILEFWNMYFSEYEKHIFYKHVSSNRHIGSTHLVLQMCDVCSNCFVFFRSPKGEVELYVKRQYDLSRETGHSEGHKDNS